MLPTKFRFIWPSGFKREDFLKAANQKKELPMAAMFVDGLGHNEQSIERTFHRCFPQKVNGRRMPKDCIWQGLLKRILKCEYLLVMYRINMLHYIGIS